MAQRKIGDWTDGADPDTNEAADTDADADAEEPAEHDFNENEISEASGSGRKAFARALEDDDRLRHVPLPGWNGAVPKLHGEYEEPPAWLTELASRFDLERVERAGTDGWYSETMDVTGFYFKSEE
jgi:hypothetical protein